MSKERDIIQELIEAISAHDSELDSQTRGMVDNKGECIFRSKSMVALRVLKLKALSVQEA